MSLWETLSLSIALFLLANMAAGLLWAFRGTAPVGYLQAALLFGTTGVAILLLLAEAMGAAGLRDVALVLVGLATLTVVVFTGAGSARQA